VRPKIVPEYSLSSGSVVIEVEQGSLVHMGRNSGILGLEVWRKFQQMIDEERE
jgi:hypothetical protein